MTMVMPSLRLIALLGSISGRVTKIVVDSMGFDGSDYCVRLYHYLVGGVVVFSLTANCYLDLYRRGFDVSAVRYEDLVARPLEMCRVVLDYCHLSVSLAEQAVKAFDVDSQRNSPMPKSIIGRFKEPQLTPQLKTKLNQLLKGHGIPLIGESCVLEGTLSCSQSE